MPRTFWLREREDRKGGNLCDAKPGIPFTRRTVVGCEELSSMWAFVLPCTTHMHIVRYNSKLKAGLLPHLRIPSAVSVESRTLLTRMAQIRCHTLLFFSAILKYSERRTSMYHVIGRRDKIVRQSLGYRSPYSVSLISRGRLRCLITVFGSSITNKGSLAGRIDRNGNLRQDLGAFGKGLTTTCMEATGIQSKCDPLTSFCSYALDHLCLV